MISFAVNEEVSAKLLRIAHGTFGLAIQGFSLFLILGLASRKNRSETPWHSLEN
jgi:hypothetical protein